MRPPARPPHTLTINIIITEGDRRTSLLTVLDVIAKIIQGIDELRIPANPELGANVTDFEVTN